MTDKTTAQPTVIKKYANRRLYHTGTSTYVTLDDLAIMVQAGEHFVVRDAKTDDDLTRSILTQIIVEQENKTGQSLLPISFLRDIISFYGDSMQSLVPSFLEQSFASFVAQTEEWRNAMTDPFNAPNKPFEDQVQRNMDAFQHAMTMFNPFNNMQHMTPTPQESSSPSSQSDKTSSNASDQSEMLKQMQQQLAEMQQKINKIDKTS